MSEWGNIQGRKGKKNKKKQSNSMSEPIDLEAGKRIDEPEAANIAKAVYNIPGVIVSPPDEDTTNDDFVVVEAPKSDMATEQSATATDAGVLKTMKAFIQHPPKTKTKAKLADEKDTAKTTQRDSGTEATEVVVPRPSITTPKEDSTKQPSIKDTVDTSETAVTEVAKTKATSKAAPKKTVRIQEPPVESNQADAAQQPKLATVKSEAKAKLSLNPAVSVWSFALESPRINTARSNTLIAGYKGAAATSRDDLEVLKSRIERSLGPKNVAPYPSVSMREDFNMGYKSMPPKTDRASSSHGLPSLDPFDHAAFSRFNNVRRPTVNDYGNILNVQTEEGKMTHVHERVLCQTSKYFQDLCGPVHGRNRGDSNTLAWGPQSNFDGITSTYVHWLYNSNFPTAVIDVSDRTKVGEVLLYLAEEYVFGTQIQDREYRNAIMDAFITIHVRVKKLTFRSVVHVVYESTDPGSPFRQLLADMHAFIVIGDLSNLDMMGRMPKAFVQDVLQSVAVIRPNEVDEWWWYLEKTGKMYHV